MSTTTTAVERCQPVMSDAEPTTLLGFLAGYRGYTRDAYTLDLRQFTAWCWQRHHRLFEVRRVDIECFARELEDRGKARAAVARRLCTIVGFYRYAEEGVMEHSPVVHIRRPRVDYESHVDPWTVTSWVDPRHRRSVVSAGSCAGVAVGVERVARVGGDRRQHRSSRARAWASHVDGVA
jgi:Phage integrase, N-terminal SAM-like domain